MKVLVIKPNEDPCWVDTENTAEAFSGIVGGETEVIPVLIRDTVIVVNRDAKLEHLPMNFITENDIIAGDVILTAMHGGQFTEISDNQAKAFFSVYLPDFHLSPSYKQLFGDSGV